MYVYSHVISVSCKCIITFLIICFSSLITGTHFCKQVRQRNIHHKQLICYNIRQNLDLLSDRKMHNIMHEKVHL